MSFLIWTGSSPLPTALFSQRLKRANAASTSSEDASRAESVSLSLSPKCKPVARPNTTKSSNAL